MSDSIKPSPILYLASFGALLGALSMGLSLGYSSPAFHDMTQQDNKTAEKSPIYDPNKEVIENTKSTIGSMLTIGALVGGIMCEPSNKFLGRRLSLIFFGVPFIIGWLVITLTNNFLMICLGRLLTGFCSGLVSGIAPSYVVEIAPPKIRGLLGTCFQVMVTLGIFLEALVGRWLGWHALAGVSLIPALGMSIIMIFMPETPQFLLSIGRYSEAEASIKRLRVSDVESELNIMKQEATKAQKQGSQYTLEFMRSRIFIKPLLLSLGLMFFQQFSGINAVLFYQTDIFQDATDSDPVTMTIYVCLAQVIATVLGSMLVDKLGRKVLLLISGFGHALSLVMLGFYFKMSENDASFKKNHGSLSLISLIIFIVAFSLGYGPIPWMMVPELANSRARSMVAAISTSFNWVCAFIVTFCVKRLIGSVGNAKTYWLFAVLCITSCFFAMLLPETKGKSPEQIQQELFGKEAKAPSDPDEPALATLEIKG